MIHNRTWLLAVVVGLFYTNVCRAYDLATHSTIAAFAFPRSAAPILLEEQLSITAGVGQAVPAVFATTSLPCR